jgi:hypothetical protein
LYAYVQGGQAESSTKGIGQRAFLHASQCVGQVFVDVHGLLKLCCNFIINSAIRPYI